jgi:hypothetical protein
MNASFAVMSNFTQTVTVPPPGGVAANWSAQVYVYADPTCFGCYYTDDGAGHADTACIPNTVYGADVPTATAAFCAQAEQWRAVYYAATAVLDATDLTNSGNVVACQAVARPFNLGHVNYGGQTNIARFNIVQFQAEDTVEYVQAAQMPDCYTGRARDGVYMPLRMDPQFAIWRDQGSDLVLDASSAHWPTAGTELQTITVGASTAQTTGLYPDLVNAWYNTNQWSGDRHLMPCVANIGALCFENLNPAAALRITFRAGFETRVQPGSIQTPQQKPSIPYDRAAVEGYFAIRRQLKDAYPASYNDLGTLWKIIKGVAGFLEPAVSAIPGVGPAAVTIAKAVGKAVDGAMSRRTARKNQQATQKKGLVVKRRS